MSFQVRGNKLYSCQKVHFIFGAFMLGCGISWANSFKRVVFQLPEGHTIKNNHFVALKFKFFIRGLWYQKFKFFIWSIKRN